MGDDMAAVGERPPSMARMLLDRVAIAADTRLAWILADFAILCAGTATTTVHPATPAIDIAFILDDADARIVFAGDDDPPPPPARTSSRGHDGPLDRG